MNIKPLPEDVQLWLMHERLLNPETIERAGIAYTTIRDNGYITIPNRWDGAKPVAWKLRIAPSFAATKASKWLFQPKGLKNTVFGREAWNDTQPSRVFFCEGELDCLLLNQHGHAALTSSTGVGSALEDSLDLVPENSVVILAYDNDEAGQKATEKAITKIADRRRDVQIHRIVWPEGFEKDITDFFLLAKASGADAAAKLLELLSHSDTEPGNKKQKDTQAHVIVRTIRESNIVLFHDQFEDAYARIPLGDHTEIRKINGRKFELWMRMLLWNKIRKIPSSEVINSVLKILEAHACFEGKRIVLHNRIATENGAIWYDLCDERWMAVKLSSGMWKVEEPPELFRRYSHQETQLEPRAGGTVETLLRFVNIADEGQQLLFLVCLISCFIPGFPHVIMNLYGSHGSAKTTIFKMISRLIDPSKTEVLSFPRDMGELMQQLSHHWLAVYDNVSVLSEQLSDALCRAITGEGSSKRQLYTNDEDIIFAFQCCIALNGINLAAQKSDLLDRSVLFKLERIPEHLRREEREVLAEFEQERPFILGAIFDAVCKAMQLRESVILKRKPRMADFAVWGCAIAQALGHTHDEFLDAYFANIGQQHEEVIEASPVAIAVRVFVEERMQEKTEWSGTATELLAELEAIANFSNGKIQKKSLPKIPQHLTKKLNEVKSNLGAFGILIDTEYRTGKSRAVSIKKIVTSVIASDAAPASDDSCDAADDNDIRIGDMPSSEISSLFESHTEAQVVRSDDDDDAL